MRLLTASAIAIALATACSGGPRPEPPGGQASPGGSAVPGVSGSPSPGQARGPSGQVEACRLLSADDVGAAVGGPVSDGEPIPSACSWRGEPGLPVVSAALVRIDDPQACATARPPGAERIASLAAPAWWEYVEAEVGVGSVLACPEGFQMIVTLSGGDAGERPLRAAAEQLAAIALARL